MFNPFDYIGYLTYVPKTTIFYDVLILFGLATFVPELIIFTLVFDVVSYVSMYF